MKCAVINSEGIIINMIQADPAVDAAPVGYVLYEVTADIWTDIGQAWADRIMITADNNPADEESL